MGRLVKNIDMTAVIVRDYEWGGATSGSGSTWTHDQLAETYLLAGMDRHNLLTLLAEASAALGSVGDCHGCLDNDHVEERALYDFLETHVGTRRSDDTLRAALDWTEYDAVNVLALPLHRWMEQKRYAVPGGFDGELRRLVYSNGTEHGFATERAEMVLELGPMLRRVLFEGVRALENDPQFEAYTGALAAGDHEQIVEIEREVEAADIGKEPDDLTRVTT